MMKRDAVASQFLATVEWQVHVFLGSATASGRWWLRPRGQPLRAGFALSLVLSRAVVFSARARKTAPGGGRAPILKNSNAPMRCAAKIFGLFFTRDFSN